MRKSFTGRKPNFRSDYQVWIFDRDGVINEKAKFPNRYILHTRDLVLNAELINFIVLLQRNNKQIAVATNQQCVGKGLIDEFQLRKIHEAIDESLIRIGGSKIEFFVCGHLESDKCICRKPSPGMLKDIIAKYSAKLQDTIFIGDSKSDEVAARNTGIDFLHIEELLHELNRKQI